MPPTYPTVESMLADIRPMQPVYCVHPGTYLESTQRFLSLFSGRVLYAVKANDEPLVLRALHSAGVRHFDCASVPEIRAIAEQCPGARCYLMNPARLRGAAIEAVSTFGVRHFAVDDIGGLRSLGGEIDLSRCVVFARLAARHPSAKMDLSSKFGAGFEEMPGLVEEIVRQGAEPALCFNVGSGVTSPEAYTLALSRLHELLPTLSKPIRLLDVGGGFPFSYPGYEVPPLEDFLGAISQGVEDLPLAPDAEILAEPGRALAAPGLSAVTQVLLRKDERIYLNDGMFGIFWELRFDGHKHYPTRVYRDGRLLEAEPKAFTLYGPTCDASDVLPQPFLLPSSIQPGDYVEFLHIGAYSLSGLTRFNGFYSNLLVEISNH